MNHRTLLSLAAALLLSACATVSPTVSAPPPAGAPGLVSAADPRAAEAGAQMLRAGGSATDAAIATMLALTVVEPQSSGIGGGGFYVRAAPGSPVETIDGRETAPAAAHPGWFLDAAGKPMAYRPAVLSGLSVGVPGNIALAAQAHKAHGRLPWARLFDPAIALAREGWTVSARTREFLVRSKDGAARDAAGRALFFGADGEAVAVGTLVRNPALADALGQMATGGARAFYTGDRAARIADTTRAATPGGKGMTARDVADYRPRPREPLCGTYRAYRICGMAPPSSGATTVLAILGQMERFDMKALGPQSPVAWHLFAESQRLAYADREQYLADPDFVKVPAAGLVDAAYLAARSQLIAADKTMAEVAHGSPRGAEKLALASGLGAPEQGTSHFVAVDRFGEVVTYTSTIEGSFGSGIMVDGFYLNNELTDFSMVAERDGKPVANRVQGGKRPRSSMAPTLVWAPDGSLWLAVGAAGGGTIPVQVAKAIMGAIDFGLSVDQALALPALYSPGETVWVEKGSALEAMIPALKALGHADVQARQLPLKANAAMRVGDRWQGGADPRSDGVAVGE